MKKKRLIASIEEQTLRELKAHAKEANTSISQIVNEAIADYLGKVRM